MNNFQNKVCCIIDNGLFCDLALTLAKRFGKVLYYTPWEQSFPRSNEILIGEGLLGVTRINSIWPVIDDVDLFVFPDIFHGPLQVHLVKLGKRVWGGRLGENLEILRGLSKSWLRGVDLPVGPYRQIRGLDALREYLEGHPDQYVKIARTRGDMETFHAATYKLIEPRLDELEHSLGAKKAIQEFIVEAPIEPAVEVGYDGYTIDGKYPQQALYGVEVKDTAYLGQVVAYRELPSGVQEVNRKLSGLFQDWTYRGFWSSEIRIKAGKPYLIDPCFSDDTEVLTNVGWKLFSDLDKTEDICTLNPDTGEIEYQAPTDYISHPYDGDLVLISNKERGIECLVTPNHSVWRTDRNGNGLFAERADELKDKGYIPRTGKWIGKDIGHFSLPAYQNTWKSGRGVGVWKTKNCPPVDIQMADWLSFLGLYLAEGSIHSKWAVNISQMVKRKQVFERIKNLPFKITESKHGFVVHSVQLAEHLRGMGLCNTKRVPTYIKQLSSVLIESFLSAYCLGDGSIKSNGQRRFITTSKEMADDLQELIFKCGKLSNITVNKTAGTKLVIGGKSYTRRFDTFVVTEVPKQNRFWFEASGFRKGQYISRVAYSGMVYDVTVPNHIVYVRRNGKPFWSGNCCRMASPPGELYQTMITNLADILWHGAMGDLVEPEFEDKWGAQIVMRSSWAEQNWQPIDFPNSIRDNVKLHYSTRIGGRYYVIPQEIQMAEIGAVVATGSSADDAIKNVTKIAEKIEGYGIKTNLDALQEAKSDMEKLKNAA